MVFCRQQLLFLRPGCFFFVVAPFCSCPASLVSRKFFAVGPGCAKCFFCCTPLGAVTFRRGQSKKKNTTQGVFFFAPAPRGRSLTHCGPGWRCLPLGGVVFFFFAAAPPGPGWCFFFLLWPRPDAHSLTVGWGDFGKARVVFFFLLRPRRVFLDNNKKCLGYYIGSKKTRRGHSKKKTPLPRFFFCSGPVPAPNGASPSPAVPGAGAKKNTPWVVFFFFCSGPVPASNGASPSLAFRRGRSKKKKNTLGGVFFLLWPRAGAQRGFSFPCLSPGPEQKKKTPWVVFFFLLRPRADAHSLTAGLGGDASPSAGWCFFFAAAPPGPGWCFFFLLWPRPDAHSLTVGWGDFGKARVVFFFCCGPAGSF